MAEISLRAYIEYIGDRLDRDAYSEVVAQCRHILETYPKHIETYKQLARALAAQGNYTDALDLFQRVLSADPTDFIAHIGMSECYKEDGALEQAIWHLERAFEQVPGNADLQDALKQLYEQRDRKAPRKIQMTGGALARMYIKGKLYPQAISELTKAIARDPDRLDLQVLMADALWHAHQYVAAGKVAGEVLKKLPYSIEANRILAQLWRYADQPLEARLFVDRVKELDPYLGYELEHDGQAAPPDAFHLVMLDFTTSQVTGRVDVADWVAEIDGIEKKRDVTGPLTAQAASMADTFAPPPSAPSRPAPEAAAPDWLQEALRATGSTPAGAAATPGALAGAEPDWLRDALAGTGEPSGQPGGPPADDAPDWLKDALGPSAPAQPPVPTSVPSEGAPDWLQDVIGKEEALPSASVPLPGSAGSAPDWLQDVLSQETPAQASPVSPAAPAGGAPDWLQDVLSQETPVQPPPAPSVSPAPAGDAPEWLQDALTQGQPAEPPPAPEAATPAWLDEMASPEKAASEASLEPPAPPVPAEPTPPENAPEWLAKVLSERTPPSLEPVPADWGQPAGGEARSEPEWLSKVGPAETPPPAAPPVVSEEWLDEFITGGVPSAIDEQAQTPPATAAEPVSLETLGDLETWDAPEEVIPSSPPEGWLTQDTGLEPPKAKEPEEESPALPDWLATGAALETSDSGVEPEGAEPEASAEKELPDWLKVEPAIPAEAAPTLEEEIHVAPDDELKDGDTSPDDTPDWLASGDLDSDDALKWLEEIAARVDPNFKPSTSTEEEAAPVAAAPEPAKAEVEEEEKEEPPEWLKTEAAPAAAVPEPAKAEAEEEEELPEWLKTEAAPAAAVPEPAKAEAEEEEELPEWLKTEAAPAAAALEPAEAEAEKEEQLPEWLKTEAAPAAAAPEPAKAEAEEEEEELEWLRKPTEEPARAEAEEEGLPAWLRAEEKEALPAPAAAVPEPSGALAWLDEQAAGQGVSADQIVSEALTPDHPPVAASMVSDEDAEAKRVTTGELPSWLADAGAREEMAKALESPVGEPEMTELPEMTVEADELAWLNETLKAEEQAAGGIDLEDILGEKPPAAAPAGAKAEEKEEELPEWLSKPETAPAAEAKEEELPEWLTKPEAAPAAEAKEELPAWLAEPEGAPTAEAKEEELPEWLIKSEAAPAAEAKAGEKEEEEALPEWLKGPEPVPAAKAEEEEPEWLKKPEPALAAQAKEEGEELPEWLEKPEEAPVIEAKEGAEELPDWLTKTEVEAAPVPEPVEVPSIGIKEEEGKLPDWLSAPEPAAVETDLADFLKAVEPAAAPVAEAQPTPPPEPAAPVAAAPPPPPAAAPLPVIPVGDAAAQLKAARDQVGAGELQAALGIYEALAASGQHLDEIVADLSDVVKSRVVVNPRVYRVMGDAMMGQGRMQEALDMYRKALDQF